MNQPKAMPKKIKSANAKVVYGGEGRIEGSNMQKRLCVILIY
jgi:hypothetical protein